MHQPATIRVERRLDERAARGWRDGERRVRGVPRHDDGTFAPSRGVDRQLLRRATCLTRRTAAEDDPPPPGSVVRRRRNGRDGRPNACDPSSRQDAHVDRRLARTLGTARRSLRSETMSNDRRVGAVAAEGDTGRRGILARAMGRRPAQQASGPASLAPYLALTQKDPYDAVRIVASRSLKTLPAFRRDRLPGYPQLLMMKTEHLTLDA